MYIDKAFYLFLCQQVLFTVLLSLLFYLLNKLCTYKNKSMLKIVLLFSPLTEFDFEDEILHTEITVKIPSRNDITSNSSLILENYSLTKPTSLWTFDASVSRMALWSSFSIS